MSATKAASAALLLPLLCLIAVPIHAAGESARVRALDSEIASLAGIMFAALACGPSLAAEPANGKDGAALESAASRLAALGRRLQRLQDANDIEILQRTYGYFVDKGIRTEISDLFAENGTYEIGGRGVFVGKQRVLEYLRVGLGAERPVEGRLINHMQFQPITDVAPDGLSAHLRSRSRACGAHS